MPCQHINELRAVAESHQLQLSSDDLIRIVCPHCGIQEVCPSIGIDEYERREAALQAQSQQRKQFSAAD